MAARQNTKSTRGKSAGKPAAPSSSKPKTTDLPTASRAASPRKSDLTRQRILQAAARVFREQGYAGTRLSDVATAAGMKTGSLYYHFDSREALVEEVVQEGVRRAHEVVTERLRKLPADTCPLQKVEAAIETHLAFVLREGDISSASIQLISQVPAEIRERTLAVQRIYGALWRQLLEQARDAGALRADVNLSAIRMSILGALNWAPEWYRPSGASPKQIAHDISVMVLHGLAKGKGF